MKDISYIFRTYWLVVPEFIYVILLYGSYIIMIISLGIVIGCILRKSEKMYYIKWLIILLVAFILAVLTMTGKIAPHTAFGG